MDVEQILPLTGFASSMTLMMHASYDCYTNAQQPVGTAYQIYYDPFNLTVLGDNIGGLNIPIWWRFLDGGTYMFLGMYEQSTSYDNPSVGVYYYISQLLYQYKGSTLYGAGTTLNGPTNGNGSGNRAYAPIAQVALSDPTSYYSIGANGPYNVSGPMDIRIYKL